MADRRAFTLQPLVEAGVFEPGENALSCSVGGVEYFADLGSNGEIIFEGQYFKSPSAFSVFVKRKVNPSRKADDGWTSCKYRGELLSMYRPQLENLLGGDGRSGITASPLRSHTTTKARKKRTARKDVDSEFEESSFDDGMEPSVGPGMEYSGRLSPGPFEGNGYGDGFPTTSAPSPRRTRRNTGRNYLKMEDDGYLDDEVDGGLRSRPQAQQWQHQTYSMPQQYTDEEVERPPPDQGEWSWHLQGCRRPPLGICTEQEFEDDLYAFLAGRGEGDLANDLRNKRVNCNNLPIDIFGLYREVIRHGGFVDNERYDDYNRWTGGINFGGKIFPRMKNYTPYNRATSVGNQLLNNYRKFLLAYEICHRAKDLAGAPTPSITGEQQPANSDALAVLADVAGSARDEMEVAGQLKLPEAAPAKAVPHKTRSKRGAESFGEDELLQAANHRKRSRVSGTGDDASARFINALCRIEHASGRYVPGTLLLAQSPIDLTRHWPVLVMAVHDLPRGIISGGCTPDPSIGFPMTLEEVSPKNRPEEAYPVLVIGTQMMGWVETGSCRRYSQSAGDSALASIPQEALRGLQSGVSAGEAYVSFVCAKALKFAVQYSRSNDPQQAIVKGMCQAAATRVVAQRLLDVEARLPAENSVCCSSFGLWQTWRRNVERAESVTELMPQVLTLAHQLSPSILRRGAIEVLWDELRSLLDMQPAEQPTLDSMSSQAQFSLSGPSVINIDDAVSAISDAIDWNRLRHTSLPAAHSLPTPGSRLRNGMKPSREPLKHSAINNAYDDSRAVSPSSPGHPSGIPPAAHKRLLREAEPTTSGHSGHTPKAQQPLQDHPDAGHARSAFDFRHASTEELLVGGHHSPVPPTGSRGGRGGSGMSRLQAHSQAVSRDASFGSGAASGSGGAAVLASPQRPAMLGGDLRSGSFKFAQVMPRDGAEGAGDGMRQYETPRYPAEPRAAHNNPFHIPPVAAIEHLGQSSDLGHDQHASFGRELVGGNDMEDDNGATDLDIDGDGSGAAGGSGDNAQDAKQDNSMSTGSAYPAGTREQEAEANLGDPGGPSMLPEEDPSSAKDPPAVAREVERPIPHYPLMREV